MFTSQNGDFDIQKSHINNKGIYVVTAGLNNNGILGKSDIKAKVFEKNTITIDMFGNAFYRHFNYKMVTHARVFSLIPNFFITNRQGLFLVNSLYYLRNEFGFDNMCSWEKIKLKNIQLPVKNNEIDFDFMESFIAELETQRIIVLKAYLNITGLSNIDGGGRLTEEEKHLLANFNNLKWGRFNLCKLFGKSTRGKRLKSADRIPGNLPFVTAGEAETGVSAYIGNSVEVFSKNTVTIDMFGSAKYRNYDYGCDDHIAVVHTENLSRYAAIFITSAVHKSSHNGQFNYGKNFYPKDADSLDIMLPVIQGQPDFNTMETIISAIHKLVIKDVVNYTDKKN